MLALEYINRAICPKMTVSVALFSPFMSVSNLSINLSRCR